MCHTMPASPESPTGLPVNLLPAVSQAAGALRLEAQGIRRSKWAQAVVSMGCGGDFPFLKQASSL
jgi:hypothetical protein